MRKFVTIALLSLTPASALAEGAVNGAELGFAWSGFLPSDTRAANNLALHGALDYGFTPNLAAQLDLAQHHYTYTNDEGGNVTLHAIGHVGQATALGAFLGHEWIDGDHLEHYGLEAKHEFGLIGVEGYTAWVENDTTDASIIGLSGSYAMSEALSFGGRFETIDTEGGTDTTALDATVAYAMPHGVTLDGSLGLIDGNKMDTEVTFGLGIRTTLGGNGVTFGRRGVQELIPGY